MEIEKKLDTLHLPSGKSTLNSDRCNEHKLAPFPMNKSSLSGSVEVQKKIQNIILILSTLFASLCWPRAHMCLNVVELCDGSADYSDREWRNANIQKRREEKKVKISRCDRHSVSVQSSFKSLTCVTCASTSAAR